MGTVRTPRLAAGRARALGLPTRGTTNPNRLRRMDNWIAATQAGVLNTAAEPLVIDLGFGASPVTTVELLTRLRRVRSDVRVLGVELDPQRVAGAALAADPPWLDFVRGGFEFAGYRPVLVRAANVLRQYDEQTAAAAWQRMQDGLVHGGVIVEGTCDEVGRRATWVLLDAAGPRSLTLACRVGDIARPGDLAERLPKALIHHNVEGRPVHRLLSAFDSAWEHAAAHSAFGPRQRWIAACRTMSRQWPVLDGPARWRLGELTVAWAALR